MKGAGSAYVLGELKLHLERTVTHTITQEIKTRESDMRARITQEVNARWDAVVEKVIEERLAAAIAKIRAEFGVP
jgi:hypothetical protein